MEAKVDSDTVEEKKVYHREEYAKKDFWNDRFRE